MNDALQSGEIKILCYFCFCHFLLLACLKGKKNIRINEYEDMIYLNISFRSEHCSVLFTETRKLRHWYLNKEKINNCLKSEQLFRNFRI